MNELAVLGESLRRDLEGWLHAQCAGWLPDDHVQIEGLEAMQAIAADTAALLSACYQAVALDAWLTAGYLPAERAAFDEQVTAMALADSGADAAIRGPGAAAGSAAPGARARLDPAAARGARGLDAPRASDTWTAPGTRALPDTRTTPAMPARSPMPARDLPAAPPSVEDASPRASAGAGTRPGSGFQRLKGLHELAARAQSLDGAGRLPEPARHVDAPARSPSTSDSGQGASPADQRAEAWPRPLPAEVTAEPGPARATGSPVRAAPGSTPGARPGAERDDRSSIESASDLAVRMSSAVRARSGDAPGTLGRGDDSSAEARADVFFEELRASFRPLTERTAAADASWPAGVGVIDRATHAMPAHAPGAPAGAGQGRSGPAQRSRPETAAAASWPGLAPGVSMAGAEPAFTGIEPAMPPAGAAQRARASEQALAPAPAVDELLPSDIESILEVIAEDLERDFARLYGGG